MLHNPDLSEDEKGLLKYYGAVRIESVESILKNIPDLTTEEEVIIRKHVFTKGTRAQYETQEMTPERQELFDRLLAKLYEIDTAANPTQK